MVRLGSIGVGVHSVSGHLWSACATAGAIGPKQSGCMGPLADKPCGYRLLAFGGYLHHIHTTCNIQAVLTPAPLVIPPPPMSG